MTEHRFIDAGGLRVAVRLDGARDGPALVLAHGLGLDASVFDAALPHLPQDLRIVRYDARGHGASAVTAPPYGMGRLVRDAEAVCDGLGLGEIVFAGHGLGGLTGIGLAVKRPGIMRALVLSNTAAKIGTAATWASRIAQIEGGGLTDLAEADTARWFAPGHPARAGVASRLAAGDPAGHAGAAGALAGADLREVASGLALPTLCIAGSHDGAVPPDLVRETARTIPGAEFVLLRRAGHLPFIDHPEAFAAAIAGFLFEIGVG